jgi:hypothetical protein
MEDSLENFSRKIYSTVGLLVSNCGTLAEIFLEKFALASPKNLRKLSYFLLHSCQNQDDGKQT